MADLTGLNIKDTYQELVTVGSGYPKTITDGTGSLITNLTVTASFATWADNAYNANYATTAGSATSASYAPVEPAFSSSVDARLTNAEDNISNLQTSVTALNLETGSLQSQITANASSISGLNAETGSYMLTGSVSGNILTFDKVDGTQFVLTVDTGSADFATSASYAAYAATAPYSGLLGTVPTWNQNTTGTAATASYVAGANVDGAVALATSASYSSTTGATLQNITDNGASTTNAITTPGIVGNYLIPTSGDTTVGGVTGDLNLQAAGSGKKVLIEGQAGVVVSGSVDSKDNITAPNFIGTGSYALDSDKLDGLHASAFAQLAQNNTFSGNQTFNDITVNGTGSFSYIQTVTGSATVIGDAFIVLNTNDVSRYAGILVEDSGSATPQNYTASFFFDAQLNDWNYEYTENGDTDLAVALFGPAYDTKGIPTYLTQYNIPRASGSHHLIDSSISDNGSAVSIGLPLNVTGQVSASSYIGDGSQLTGVISSLSASAESGQILFENIAGEIYGSSASPVTGNIAVSGASAKVNGAVAIVYHQDTAEPTITGATVNKKVGIYDTSALNIITLTNIDGTNILEYIAGGIVTSVASASYADYAVSASHAIIADSALAAGSATSASYATYAASAGTAASATSATSASKVEVTDTGANTSLSVALYENTAELYKGMYRDSANNISFNPSTNILDVTNVDVATSLTVNNYTLPSADGSSGQAIVTNGAGTLSFASVVTTGTTATGVTSVVFDNSIATVYNTAASPATGNITLSGTGAVVGGTAVIYHNDSTAPTISGLTVDKTLGVYSPSNLNIITIIYTGANVIVSIAGISPAVEGSQESGNLLFENQIGEIYGTSGTPLTGNITIDGSSTKVIGASCILYHQDSTEPTVSGGTIVKKVGSYDTTGLNMIAFVYLGSGNYIQTIAGADVTGIITNTGDTYTSTAKVQSIVTCTAAEYAAIGTPDANTFYIVI